MQRERFRASCRSLLAFSDDALEQLATDFVDNEQVANTEEALIGARDILAERFADDASIREKSELIHGKMEFCDVCEKYRNRREKCF